MITAERLEELIKQGATIYHINGKSIKLHLKDGNMSILAWVQDLNELFETQEQAEWALKTTAERTERFEPPMWEDRTVEHMGYTFTFVLNNEVYVFRANQFKDEIRLSKIAYDGLLFDNRETTLFLAESFIKENYIKACEIVRDLFNIGAKKN